MIVSEVRKIAIEWAMEYFNSLPRVQGALFAGSINDRRDDSEWTDGSDVDIYFYQSGEITPRAPKLLFRELIMEPSHHPADLLLNTDKILGDPHQATHIARGNIICDPNGLLKKTQQTVKPQLTELEWIHKRMMWAYSNAESKLTGCIKSTTERDMGLIISFSLGVRNIAALPAIAALRNPTLRRCAVVSRDILSQYGYDHLHEEMLDIYGSRSATPSAVRALIPPLMELFRRASVVSNTPFFFSFEFEPAAEPLFQNGIQEMIDSGDHREAMLFVLFLHAVCGQAIAFDGTEQDKLLFQKVFNNTNALVGGQSLADIHERSRRSMAFLPSMMKACESIAKASSTAQQEHAPDAQKRAGDA